MRKKDSGGPKPGGCAVVENANTAKSIDGKRDRMMPAGVDIMTGKHYFYRGGVAKPIASGTGSGSDQGG